MLPNNTLSKSEYFRQNRELSCRYKEDVSKEEKIEILYKLYVLTGPLFKSNKIPRYIRDDFEQDSFLWLRRALNSFNPEKGAFISWLKGYIRSYTRKDYGFKRCISDEMVERYTETDNDFLMWEKIRCHLGSEDWETLLKVLENDEKSKIRKEVVLERVRAFVKTIGITYS